MSEIYCPFSDLFSLQLAALWTAVLGEWDREIDENTEIRIPVENIFVHEHFNNFQHDIGKGYRLRVVRTKYIVYLEKVIGWLGSTQAFGSLIPTLFLVLCFITFTVIISLEIL